MENEDVGLAVTVVGAAGHLKQAARLDDVSPPTDYDTPQTLDNRS